MPETAERTRIKRARTGCFKCRVRRRKCDEGKPSCRRCVDGGFSCQYGTRLSFLEKNAKTVKNSPKASRTSYSALKFVVPEPADVRFKDNSSETGTNRPTPASSISDTPLLPKPSPASPLVVPTPAAPQFAQDIQTPTRFDAAETPSEDAYESALDILLSLGASHVPQTDAPVVPVTAAGTLGPSVAPLTSDSPKDGGHDVDEFTNCAHLATDRIVRAMRQYRYNIAPWLDICDPHETFGLAITRMASHSIPVFESICAFSPEPQSNDARTGFGQQFELPVTERLLVTTFSLVRQHITTPPVSWLPPLESMGFEQYCILPSHAQEMGVMQAVSWLILRLEVSVGLMNSTCVGIPGSPDEQPLEFGKEPLRLCADTLNFCFGPEYASTPTQGAPSIKIDCWKRLFASLNTWYSSRPEEFSPMIELDEANRFFPLILFTNGAALMANQMYHTAALILLLCRPRTLQNDYGRSFIISPLWHAQRICGISLNNSSRDCWDFSLVASLYLAAKQMTFEPQQQEILAGLESIGGITKWNLDHLATKLVQEWQPV